jgi:hypothetical protein
MIDFTESDDEISWHRAALSGMLDLAVLALGLAGIVSLIIIAAALMGKL